MPPPPSAVRHAPAEASTRIPTWSRRQRGLAYLLLQIDGRDPGGVIAQECLPTVGGCTLALDGFWQRIVGFFAVAALRRHDLPRLTGSKGFPVRALLTSSECALRGTVVRM